jgi:hypothetical protein
MTSEPLESPRRLGPALLGVVKPSVQAAREGQLRHSAELLRLSGNGERGGSGDGTQTVPVAAAS